MLIKNILFDADGVLQYPTVHWQSALKSVLKLEDDAQAEAVLCDIFEAETEVLESRTGFIEKLEVKLAKWNRPDMVFETLNALLSIEVHSDIMRTVQCLRRAGIRCHIGSNQQALRAKHMSEVLNYKSLFDSEFYSCFMGTSKPKPEFFEKTIATLDCHASDILFLDDRAENVEAAKRVGLNAMVFFGEDGALSLEHGLAGFGVFTKP
ncbi:MAG: HAD-superfamily hydrolase, subfamily variant 3 [Proteobacteria bacterium]|nr:HAD-superfamily hydrolase, subfamily variant 3 [Pseudomonadota bacterium]